MSPEKVKLITDAATRAAKARIDYERCGMENVARSPESIIEQRVRYELAAAEFNDAQMFLRSISPLPD